MGDDESHHRIGDANRSVGGYGSGATGDVDGDQHAPAHAGVALHPNGTAAVSRTRIVQVRQYSAGGPDGFVIGTVLEGATQPVAPRGSEPGGVAVRVPSRRAASKS